LANGAYSSASFGDFMKAHDTVNGARSARYCASVSSYEELMDGTTGLTYNESDVNGSKGVKREVVITVKATSVSNFFLVTKMSLVVHIIMLSQYLM
jgi:hypothetical protein